MKKGNHKSAILALPIVLSLAMVGCGSGGGGDDVSTGDNNGENGDSGDNNNGNGSDGSGSIDGGSQSGGGASTDSDEGENASQQGGSDAQPVVSSVWAGATCSEYDVGIYFKSLYQFGDGGELLTGAQMYQDEACTTPGSGYKKPQSNDIVMTTYSIAAMETLADGTNGYPIHLERTIEWPEMPEPPEPDGMDEECDPEDSVYACETNSDGDIADDGSEEDDDLEDDTTIADAYLGLKDAKTLCFSSNVFFDTEVTSLEMGGDVSVMDYEHCLTLFSSVDDLPATSVPFPETDPDEADAVVLTNTGWLADNICYPDENGEGSYQRVFEFLFSGVVLNSSFLDYPTPDCTGEGFPDQIAWTEDQGQFADLGEETLADGVVGHRIQITNPATNLSETSGYYVINNMEQLCLSYNLGLNSEANAASTDIDYEHCLKPYDWAAWEEEE